MYPKMAWKALKIADFGDIYGNLKKSWAATYDFFKNPTILKIYKIEAKPPMFETI